MKGPSLKAIASISPPCNIKAAAIAGDDKIAVEAVGIDAHSYGTQTLKYQPVSSAVRDYTLKSRLKSPR